MAAPLSIGWLPRNGRTITRGDDRKVPVAASVRGEQEPPGGPAQQN